jgi:tetratricopeptide (TPR) repeat protein
MLSILIKDKIKNLNKMMLFSIGLLPILLLAYINYSHSKAYSSPVNFYDNAIEKDSTRAYYYQIIGNYYTEKGEFDKAQTYFEKAAGNQEGYYKRHFQLGEIAMMKKEYRKAIGHYKDALRLKPDEKNLMFALSQAYISAVQTDSAKSVWIQMTEKFPDSPEAYFELFNLALMNFDYDMIDKYGKSIVKAKFQNKVLSGRLNAVAQQAFKEKAIRDAVFFWDYAYAMDTANYKLLKYISGSYYVLLEKDSTRKYYNLFKEKGGSFSQAEEDTYTKFLN